MTVPAFRYHPDPVASGSCRASTGTCCCCGQARGYVYTGPVYSEDDLDGALCPWCIADGSAHDTYDATFVDEEAFPDSAPESAVREIVERTPGFATWQSERWPCCCGDAAAFLMPAGSAELRSHSGLEGFALNHILYELGISGTAALRLVDSLHRDRGPTAYVFQCLACSQYLFHIDRP